MPIQNLLDHSLDRYRAPGEHDFRALRPGVVVCQRCDKEELVATARASSAAAPATNFRP